VIQGVGFFNGRISGLLSGSVWTGGSGGLKLDHGATIVLVVLHGFSWCGMHETLPWYFDGYQRKPDHVVSFFKANIGQCKKIPENPIFLDIKHFLLFHQM